MGNYLGGGAVLRERDFEDLAVAVETQKGFV